jgi:hypothetical protein
VHDHRAVGQAPGQDIAGDFAAGAGLDPLSVQHVIHLTGPRPGRKPLTALPAPREPQVVGMTALPARPVPGCQRGRLIGEKQRRVPAGRHHVAVPAAELQHAADPHLRAPAGHAESTVGPVDAAPVAHQQAARRVSDDLADGQDAVAQRHGGSLSLTPARSSARV